MRPGISVCFIVKNALINGYPFWESLESCLPFADEFVISEGCSDDDTAKFINNFATQHQGKVRIFRDDWSQFKSPDGGVIRDVSNLNLRRCEYEWIYYLQADEIVHPNNCPYIRMIADTSQPVNSVEFWFVHFLNSWVPVEPGNPPENWPGYYNAAIRMVRNRSDIVLRGDAWTFGGSCDPRLIAELAPKYLYHLAWVFPESILRKRIEKAAIYTENQDLQKLAQEAREMLESGSSLPDLEVGYFSEDVPESILRLVGMARYEPPEIAFRSDPQTP